MPKLPKMSSNTVFYFSNFSIVVTSGNKKLTPELSSKVMFHQACCWVPPHRLRCHSLSLSLSLSLTHTYLSFTLSFFHPLTLSSTFSLHSLTPFHLNSLSPFIHSFPFYSLSLSQTHTHTFFLIYTHPLPLSLLTNRVPSLSHSHEPTEASIDKK